MSAPSIVKNPKEQIIYPERDGKPMGETDTHRRWIMWLIMMLQQYYANQQTYISGDLLLYYEEGNPRRFVVPDVFVVKNHPPGDRRVYKLWEEKRAPDIVFEITSPSTKKVDIGPKMHLYARLGVQEYFLYDPLDEYLSPPFQGYELVGGRYVELLSVASNAFYSRVLGLTLRLNGTAIELYYPNGERLLTPEERIEEEAQRAEEETRRAEIEAQRAEIETRHAHEEAQRANAAEARLAKLEAELKELRRKLGSE
jgi:Uma2 family endonuclease